ncbi:potassium channel family protein [Haliea sp. E1-2-M8]|uniref:potassium channel family protein n=1 Tax=Haliea sp. E1-2-M8 TaxID=3064706 RepID=UPI00271DBFDA|nr:potassium channel family protein [Haliea sp. E1-2-M8]MDO8862740.1 potassium channel family protein [Haliea sp. E1-2-M8]
MLVFVVNALIVSLAVVIHYEALHRLTRYLPRLPVVHRARIAIGVLGALVAHAVEVWIFALAYYLLTTRFSWGSLSGSYDGTVLDCVYFSFTVYSTLGFGDIFPEGEIRYLVGIEALTGLVLITWTASFLYYEMQRNWSEK